MQSRRLTRRSRRTKADLQELKVDFEKALHRQTWGLVVGRLCGKRSSAEAVSLKVRTSYPSASSAMPSAVRIFLSSSTKATELLFFITGHSPHQLTDRNQPRAPRAGTPQKSVMRSPSKNRQLPFQIRAPPSNLREVPPHLGTRLGLRTRRPSMTRRISMRSSSRSTR